MDLFLDPSAWASLLTLTVLEIILGVDNIVVLAILTNALPKRDAQKARSIGLGLALGLRLILLSAISWMTRLTAPVFSLAGGQFSWRDLILIGGGLFLMVKAIQEIHAEIEGKESDRSSGPRVKASFSAIISQIALMDLIFSLDSIVTAVGLARDIEVMAAAICIAVAIMYFAAEPVGEFIKRHPTTKMLALCFLILIGVALVADGCGFHIPRGYIYFAMAFAGLVEAINVWAKRGGTRGAAHAAAEGFVSKPGQEAQIKHGMPPSKQAKEQRIPTAGGVRNKGRGKKTRRR